VYSHDALPQAPLDSSVRHAPLHPNKEALAHIMRCLPGWLVQHESIVLEGCFPDAESAVKIVHDGDDDDLDTASGGGAAPAGRHTELARANRLMSAVTQTLTRGYPAVVALFQQQPLIANHLLAGLDRGDTVTESALSYVHTKDLLRLLDPRCHSVGVSGSKKSLNPLTDLWVAHDDKNPDNEGQLGKSRLPSHRIMILHEVTCTRNPK